jgi:uncharacterized metal-binding protein
MSGKIIYSCACSTNLGLLAQRVSNELEKNNIAKIVPLPDPFGDDSDFVKLAKSAELNITIDGCQVGCALKALKCRKIKPLAFCLTDMGCEKRITPVDDPTVKRLYDEVITKIGEHCA